MSQLSGPTPTFTYTPPAPVWENAKIAPSPQVPVHAPAQLPVYQNLSAPYIQNIKPSAFCQSYGAQMYPQYTQILPDSSYYSAYYAPVNSLAQSAPAYSAYHPQFYVAPSYDHSYDYLANISVPGPYASVKIVERKRYIGNFIRNPERKYVEFIRSHATLKYNDRIREYCSHMPTLNLCHGYGYYEVTDYYLENDYGASAALRASSNLKEMLFDEIKLDGMSELVKKVEDEGDDDIIVDVVGDERACQTVEVDVTNDSDGVSVSDSYDEDICEANDSP